MAGTTRDVLREEIHIDGMPLHVIDTAGLRESADRVEQEGITLRREPVRPVLEAAIQACSLAAQEKSITVELGCTPDLLAAINAPLLTPETADALAPYLPLARTLGRFYAQFSTDLYDLTLEVGGDAPRETPLDVDVEAVSQILFNLVENACKYAAGADDPTIELRAERAGDRLLVDVRDHGPGVPRRHARSIFSPFDRGARSTGDRAPRGLLRQHPGHAQLGHSGSGFSRAPPAGARNGVGGRCPPGRTLRAAGGGAAAGAQLEPQPPVPGGFIPDSRKVSNRNFFCFFIRITLFLQLLPLLK